MPRCASGGIIEVQGNVLEIEAGHARRCQLDGEREAVDAAADLTDETAGAIRAERTPRADARSLPKQTHRGALGDLFEARFLAHYGQRRESVAKLALDPERLSTGGEHSQTGQPRGQAVDQVSDGRYHVLAVGEEQQDIALSASQLVSASSYD
jgi:hypothetical protein